MAKRIIPASFAREMLTLFPLRRPFTHITEQDDGAFINLSIDIKFNFAGTLRVRAEDVREVMVQCFANGAREMGFILDGKVNWIFDPEMSGATVAIDEYGTLHDISKLQEAQ